MAQLRRPIGHSEQCGHLAPNHRSSRHCAFQAQGRCTYPDQTDRSRQFALRRHLRWTGSSGTILDLAENNGLAIASGCRVGQCESCAVPVIAGDVSYLAPAHNSEPGMCLTCQCVPASDLVLDA